MENSSLYFALCICAFKGLVLYAWAALHASSTHKKHVTRTPKQLLHTSEVTEGLFLRLSWNNATSFQSSNEETSGFSLKILKEWPCVQNILSWVPRYVSVVLSPLVMIILSSLPSLWLQSSIEPKTFQILLYWGLVSKQNKQCRASQYLMAFKQSWPQGHRTKHMLFFSACLGGL